MYQKKKNIAIWLKDINKLPLEILNDLLLFNQMLSSLNKTINIYTCSSVIKKIKLLLNQTYLKLSTILRIFI